MIVWVPLSEASKDGKLSECFFDYTPDERETTISYSYRTPHYSNNRVEEESVEKTKVSDFRRWKLFSYDGKQFLYPDRSHMTGLIICGGGYYDAGIELMQQVAELYSCERLDAKGIPLNDELLPQIESKLKDKSFLLPKTYHSRYTDGFVRADGSIASVLDSYPAGPFGMEWKVMERSVTLQFMPIVLLSPHTIVKLESDDFSGSTSKKLKISLPSDAVDDVTAEIEILEKKVEDAKKNRDYLQDLNSKMLS